MAPDPGSSVVPDDQAVVPVLRFDFEHRRLGKIAKVHAAFDLALNDCAVDLVAEILMRLKHSTLILQRNPGLWNQAVTYA
jgi:hypothetical protein